MMSSSLLHEFLSPSPDWSRVMRMMTDAETREGKNWCCGEMMADGRLPLHVAALTNAPEEVFLSLLVAFPEAAGAKDAFGKCPLNIYIEKRARLAPWTVALVCTEAAKEKNNNGEYPIHWAVANGASLDVICALVKAYPQALCEADFDGNSPLHLAASHGTSVEVLLVLLEAFPASARGKNKNGKLPLSLFILSGADTAPPPAPTSAPALSPAPPPAAASQRRACPAGCDPEVFFALPESLQAEIFEAHSSGDDHMPEIEPGDYASREALAAVMDTSQARNRAMEELLRANPHATKEKDKRGKLALHHACEAKGGCDIISKLISVYPAAASQKDHFGNAPLHLAAQNQASCAAIRALLAAGPTAATEKNKDGHYPILVAAYNDLNYDAYDTLLAAHPTAMDEKNKDGKFPLKVALEKKSSAKVIERMASEKAVNEKDRQGKLPLHWAFENKADEDVIRALVSASGETTQVPDTKLGMLPIHWALMNQASLSVLEIVCSQGWPPEELKMKDAKEGRMALHWAVACNAPIDVVSFLIERFPQATQKLDAEGRLPLHLGLQNKASCEVIRALLVAHPGAGRVKDSRKGVIPLQWALDKKVSVNTIAALVMADLPISFDGSTNDFYDFSWSLAVDSLNRDAAKSKELVEVIFDQVQMHSGACHTLAYSKDQSGRQVINIAHEEARQVMFGYILFCGRYELQEGPPVHRSATACVIAAIDHGVGGGDKPRVAIKFMRNKDQYRREMDVRAANRLSDRFVVKLLDGPKEEVFQDRVKHLVHDGRPLQKYKYGLVMPYAHRSLDAIFRQERPGLVEIRGMMKDIAMALQHLHSHGVTHGDLRLLNILRVDDSMCLIDLDAACCIGRDFSGAKFSSGVLPPEMFFRLSTDEEDKLYKRHFQAWSVLERSGGEGWQKIKPANSIVVRSFMEDRLPSAAPPYTLVPAAASTDIWAYGAILYHLCAGEPLLPVNRDDDLVDGVCMVQAISWTDQQLRNKISNATICGGAGDAEGRVVRDLLKLILRVDPTERASLQNVLHHPFFTGTVPARLASEAHARFDVFISYRVDTDAATAVLLHDRLSAANVSVFLDKQSLLPGVNWEDCFINGLLKSRCFVPIISRAAIEDKFRDLREDSPCDNVLLEYRLAAELQHRGVIERIYPLFLGENIGGVFAKYSFTRTASSCSVRAVEDKAAAHLEKQGLGSPLEDGSSVSHVLGRVTACQGGFVEGQGLLEDLVALQADRICSMVASLGGSGVGGGGGGGGASATEATLRARVQILERRLQESQERINELERLPVP